MTSRANTVIDADGDFDVRALLARLWARRWWIAGVTAVVAAGFLVAAFVMTPMYRAKTVAVVAATDRSGLGSIGSALGQLGGLASLAGIDLGPASVDVEEALAVLRSREFSETFIRDHELLPEFFPKRWDPAAQAWKGNVADHPTLAQGYEYFDRKVRSVNRDTRTGLVTLQIVWRDAAVAAEWANELIERLNSEMRERAIAGTNASISYLEQELKSTAMLETRQAISRLMEAQINQRMLASVTPEYAFRVVDRALPADPRDVMSPKKVTFLGLGILLGLVAGALSAALLDLFKLRSRAS